MVCTVTFLKIQPKKCIPVRIFVNRQKVLENALVSVNQKSTIKIQRINAIRLSGKDVRGLLESISGQLKEVLLQEEITELEQRRDGKNGKVVIELENEKWQCSVCFSMEFLVMLRFAEGRLAENELKYLTRGIQITSDMQLVTAKYHFSFEEDQKTTKFTTRSTSLVGNLEDCLEIYVHNRS